MNHRVRMSWLVLVAVSLAALLSGCASQRVPFTHEIRHQYRLTDDEVRNLQFYVSHSITLRRELDSSDRQVTGSHKLVLRSGKVIEEVVVEDHTPGVAVAVGKDVITVSFDVGSSFDFTLQSGEAVVVNRRPEPEPFPAEFAVPPDEPPPAHEALLGKYWVSVVDRGTARVQFQGKSFDALEETLQAHLLIDAEELEETVEERTVLRGRTLSRSVVVPRQTASF